MPLLFLYEGMPKRKNHVSKSALTLKKIFGAIASFLIALGTPLLVVLKLLFSLTIEAGAISLNILAAYFNLILHFLLTINTLLLKATASGRSLLAHFIPRLPKKPLLRRQAKRHPLLAAPPPQKKPLTLPNLARITPRLSLPHPSISLASLASRVSFPAPRPQFLLTISLCFFLLTTFASLQAYLFLTSLPNPHLLTQNTSPVTTKIYDRHGTLLYQFYKDQNRTPIALTNLPPYVSQSVIAIEDKNFYHHPGFDSEAIARAALANSSGTAVQGGSTITQQLIKLKLLTPEKTVIRKIKEVILAFWAERLYTKNQILEMYLNEVPFGGQTYGIEAAAETYFKKPARNLTLAEAALLAALPKAPTTLSPFGSLDKAKERQSSVLNAMVSQNYLTAPEAAQAKSEPLKIAPLETEIKAPHFVMFVKGYLQKKYGPDVLDHGLQVITTLDYPLYESATALLKKGVTAQKYLHVGNGAALITNPKTGEILTMTGSIDYFDSPSDGQVNLTTAERSPGSSIKPLNYALAFERGLLNPSSPIDDIPTAFRVPGQPVYLPQNYDGRFHGRIPARVALGSSYNIPAVKTLEKNGVINFLQFATNLGITSFSDPDRYGLSLTLGGGEVKMTDLATAYSSFANQGEKVDLNPIIQIKNYKGNILESNTSNQFTRRSDSEGGPLATGNSRVLSPRTAFLVSDILADDRARTPAFGPRSNLNIPGHTVSVKTGTTETKRDNWTIGYSFGPDPRLAAVWVGNNDNTPMSPYLESGNTGAAAIWNPIMALLLKDQPNSPIPKPSNLTEVKICALTNTLPCENCPNITTEYFTPGTEPKVACHLIKDDLEKFRSARINRP
ncbi:MAG: Penicillin-binding protein, 1A family [Microgenomates group bacterium GW2011_GWA1_48_10]|nr:MAG: Penicillin-binding protein, 1A family [Microgenomates group bacterium GW2011_GWA1_48_10]